MAYTIHPKLTPKRREWLELLTRGPASCERRGNVGYHCRRLDWTEWMVRRRDELCPISWVRKDYLGLQAMWDAGWKYDDNQLETLTDAGRAVLAGPRP